MCFIGWMKVVCTLLHVCRLSNCIPIQAAIYSYMVQLWHLPAGANWTVQTRQTLIMAETGNPEGCITLAGAVGIG